VSAYQYYEFLALDRPLDDKQRAELRSLSTRAHITATSFTNEYHWGDFRGDPQRLMRTHFDAFAYCAEWGTRWIMFAAPSAVLRPRDLEPYLLTNTAHIVSRKGRTVISLTSPGDDDDLVESPVGSLAGIAPARAELIEGDLRFLYLAWLLSVQVDDDLDDAEVEPPVPAGLGGLSAPLKAVVDFLRIDPDLIAVAAQASSDLVPDPGHRQGMGRWVERLSDTEKNTLLKLVADGKGAQARARMLRSFRERDGHSPATTAGSRTVRELWAATGERRAQRERERVERAAEQERRRREEEAAARAARLDGLVGREEQVWRQAAELIDTKRPEEYDQAVALLADLGALAERDGARTGFVRGLGELRERHSRKSGLLRRLDQAGLSPLCRTGAERCRGWREGSR
jgi:hypothetical protein